MFAGKRGHLLERVDFKSGSFRPIVLVLMFLEFRSLTSFLYLCCLFMGFFLKCYLLLFMGFCFLSYLSISLHFLVLTSDDIVCGSA
jgi:hypothetical protein